MLFMTTILVAVAAGLFILGAAIGLESLVVLGAFVTMGAFVVYNQRRPL